MKKKVRGFTSTRPMQSALQQQSAQLSRQHSGEGMYLFVPLELVGQFTKMIADRYLSQFSSTLVVEDELETETEKAASGSSCESSSAMMQHVSSSRWTRMGTVFPKLIIKFEFRILLEMMPISPSQFLVSLLQYSLTLQDVSLTWVVGSARRMAIPSKLVQRKERTNDDDRMRRKLGPGDG